MNRISYRYTVSINLLEKLEKFVQDNPNCTIDDILLQYKKLKMFYRHGLSNID